MHRLTARWVRKAEADASGAGELAQRKPPLNDLVCFHCQQAAEKYLKALLQELGVAVPRTHNLDRLLTVLLPHDGTLKPLRRILVSLSRFAVDYRYPGQDATTRQARSALRQLDRIRRTIRQRLGLLA
jgi:HEPN domain-containing protein